jgi:tRNA (cmo5U34)-methyltransferase
MTTTHTSSAPAETTDDLATASAPETGRWAFDADVADRFDDMLRRSIPQYDVMRKVVTDAALHVLDRIGFSGTKRPGVVDLGASRGEALAPIVDRVGVRGQFLACDVSEPMLDALRARFRDYLAAGVVSVERHDLRDGFPVARFQPAVVLSVLTLQFVPIEYRQRLLREAHDDLAPGGALILVEKVLGEADESQRLLTDLYWGLKRENGYAQEAIERKALALEGVLVPLTARIDEQWLRDAGFDVVETVWRYLNFVGFVAVKRR